MLSSLLIAIALLPAAEPETKPTPRADVNELFVHGQSGYGRYRIPSLYVTPKNTVLAFCEGRVKPAGLTGDIDIVLRRSTDGGKTWSPLQVVADDGPNTCGNPCPVVDQSTGIIWLPFSRSLGQDTETEIVGQTGDGRTECWLTHSTDDGVTWAKPINISDTASRPEWTWYGPGPGFGLQLASGRLFVPSYHAVAKSGIYQVHSLFSDDHGKTWQIGGILRDETTEAQAAIRTDGSLYINARNISPRNQKEVRHRVTAVSRDEGLTWKEVQEDPTLTDSSCEGSVLVYSGLKPGERSIWAFTNPPGPGRRALTIRLSYDEGKTWPVKKVVEPGSSEYSNLTRLPDGAIGLLYERDVSPPDVYTVDIVFTRLTIEEIEKP